MMLGYLLGRAGVKTVVLEKHADFLRDFRGDTVHPSTLMIMQELGDEKRALDAFRKALAINPYLEKLPDLVKSLTEKVEGRDI